MKPAVIETARALMVASVLAVLALPAVAGARDDAVLNDRLERYAGRLEEIAKAIWDRPELGYLEHHTSALLQQELRQHGFEVQAGVAGMPTAFIARRGKPGTGPVIALLAEMDALPGMGQVAVVEHAPLSGESPGHGCGHNLFGAASVAAAIALGEWLQNSGKPGELRVYGTPAEEGGSGKVFMVKQGLFDDVDVVIHWHPADRNSASQSGSMANINGRFRFSGQASHASIAPERGRSALDGVEALNYMANLMREHVPEGTRIHYSISHGGGAPNVVPATAEVHYYVRHGDHRVVREVFERLQKAAEGAAMGTGTMVRFQPIGGVHELLPNDVLGQLADQALRQIGGVRLDAGQSAFAASLQKTLTSASPLEGIEKIEPYRLGESGAASTDVGDVSWVVPTVGFTTATWPPGTAAHSWQAVAASGHAIGVQGAQNAARTISLLAQMLYKDPAQIARARAEFERRRGADYRYQSLIESDEPPLDYRRQ